MRTRSWLTPPPPTVAIEIASRRVTVVALAAGAPSVSAYASEVWPAGTVTPSPAGINIAHADVVTATLTRALERAGLTATKRAALVVPDSAARLSLLHFDQAPSRAQDLDQLVRWQLRKSTPFPLEDAIVSQTQAAPDGDGLSVAAVVARKDVIAQYEAAVASVGIDAGLVDLSSLNVMNAIMAAGAGVTGDWLVVHLSAEATTLAILRGQSLMFYRHRTSIDDEPLGALVHQTAMYHEDRLGGRAFERVWLCGTDVATDDARWQISSRLGVPVESVDIRPAADLSDRASVTPEILDALAAPVGLLVRERRAAA